MANEEIITIKNHHVEICGTPPHLEEEPDYFGYYVNEHREQWLFTYWREADQIEVWTGDCGWDHCFSLDGINQGERFWLLTCLMTIGKQDETLQAAERWAEFDSVIASLSRGGS